jgi:RTX toxin RtxA
MGSDESKLPTLRSLQETKAFPEMRQLATELAVATRSQNRHLFSAWLLYPKRIQRLQKNCGESAAVCLAVTRKFAAALIEDFETLSTKFPEQQANLLKELRELSGDDHYRFWYKKTDIDSFLDQPTAAQFKQILSNVENGYDLLKIYHMAISYYQAAQTTTGRPAWEHHDNKIYNHRVENYWEAIAKERSSKEDRVVTGAMASGIRTLGHPQKDRIPEFIPTVSETFNRLPDLSDLSVTEKTHHEQGHVIVAGQSGSANWIGTTATIGAKRSNVVAERLPRRNDLYDL